MKVDLVLTNAKVYQGKRIVECCLAIEDGKIAKVGKKANMPQASERKDLKGLLVLPGLIDSHVHLRDQEKAYKEDFQSGTAAAAAGGFTTVLDMPNNQPTTMNVATLRDRMKMANRKILVNVGFYSEFPRQIHEMKSMVEQGAVAFKLFMAGQVGGLDLNDDEAIFQAFRIARETKTLVAVHAEDRASLEKAEKRLKQENRGDIEAFLEAHSYDVEVRAVERTLKFAKQSGSRVHFCHISTKAGLKALCNAKDEGLRVTCEITPHHLLLSASDLRKLGTIALTTPPLRSTCHVRALWQGVRNALVDTMGSDHAPHCVAEKHSRSVWGAKVGIPGLETTLPLLLSAVKQDRLQLADIVKLLSEKPARIFRLNGRGFVKEGYIADLSVVDLDLKHKIDATAFKSKAKYSPFDGWMVEGKAVQTFVNGQLVMEEGEIVAKGGVGEIIRRE